MWIVLAFLFSNLFSFIMGYVLLSAIIKFVDSLPDSTTGERKRMSSKAKRAKKNVLNHNRAVVRQFAEWVNVCNFSVRFKVAIRILRAKL